MLLLQVVKWLKQRGGGPGGEPLWLTAGLGLVSALLLPRLLKSWKAPRKKYSKADIKIARRKAEEVISQLKKQ